MADPRVEKLAEVLVNYSVAVQPGHRVLVRGSTLAELLVLGVPALLVPYPGARDDHQRANARFLVDRGAGLVCEQQTFDGPTVVRYLTEVVTDGAVWKERARKAYALGRPAAARTVAEIGLAARAQGGVA